jgi:hypothetical protein
MGYKRGLKLKNKGNFSRNSGGVILLLFVVILLLLVR